ncbi:hypothetical protein SDC9_98190 [bioreactor metagenome]|uniref:Uncharacterized protein n=1 Tax=bioreactor metagenome TaxID=1076179 RepID=A0A645AGM1_9ZZZZ
MSVNYIAAAVCPPGSIYTVTAVCEVKRTGRLSVNIGNSYMIHKLPVVTECLIMEVSDMRLVWRKSTIINLVVFGYGSYEFF